MAAIPADTLVLAVYVLTVALSPLVAPAVAFLAGGGSLLLLVVVPLLIGRGIVRSRTGVDRERACWTRPRTRPSSRTCAGRSRRCATLTRCTPT